MHGWWQGRAACSPVCVPRPALARAGRPWPRLRRRWGSSRCCWTPCGWAFARTLVWISLSVEAPAAARRGAAMQVVKPSRSFSPWSWKCLSSWRGTLRRPLATGQPRARVPRRVPRQLPLCGCSSSRRGCRLRPRPRSRTAWRRRSRRSSASTASASACPRACARWSARSAGAGPGWATTARATTAASSVRWRLRMCPASA
mmetsp:Transcript_112738/g.351521  ORF Transcript_112738/g.351521 Transcript_112738/m.351521 type:complete len:201 (-) Transcript_112738:485-1087(-)